MFCIVIWTTHVVGHMVFMVQNMKFLMKWVDKKWVSRYPRKSGTVYDVENPLAGEYSKITTKTCKANLPAVNTQQHVLHCDQDTTWVGSHGFHGAKHVVADEMACWEACFAISKTTWFGCWLCRTGTSWMLQNLDQNMQGNLARGEESTICLAQWLGHYISSCTCFSWCKEWSWGSTAC